MEDIQYIYKKVQNLYAYDPGDYRMFVEDRALCAVTDGYDIWADTPMILNRYAKYISYSQGKSEDQLFWLLNPITKMKTVFNLIRLKYVIPTLYEDTNLYTMPLKPLPRMKLMSDCEVIPKGEDIIPLLFKEDFDPSRKLYLENPPDPAPISNKIAGAVSWLDLSPDKIEITADTPSSAILLVTDNYSRGWKAVPLSNDSQSKYQVLPADYFLRGIPLGPGHHHFLMEYRPISFEIGKWVAVIAWALYLIALYLSWKTIKLSPTGKWEKTQ